MRTLFRVGGILFHEGKLVTTKMKKGDQEYHVVPGGGVEDNESIYEALIRELKEELNIEITKYRLISIRELNIKDKGRGAEFYFYIEKYTGVPTLGFDPENKEVILDEVCFIDMNLLDECNLVPIQLKEILVEDYFKGFSSFRHLGVHNYQ